ncbi:hypothetical protein Acr_00g0066640 [Actinidia rufa]|uniref:Uncharacterized protein n=1 Tax=Actinidia rufa TaxID=165716 RepID=A0A7J0D7A9_9ERIC|nr:hypothetical protein Acr_00g0003780 [Actinidia rufa]GFS40085.1 hypothetical protein Acr_00g0066640 [Actinidia rufa]
MTHLDNRISRCESNSSTSKEGRGEGRPSSSMSIRQWSERVLGRWETTASGNRDFQRVLARVLSNLSLIRLGPWRQLVQCIELPGFRFNWAEAGRNDQLMRSVRMGYEGGEWTLIASFICALSRSRSAANCLWVAPCNSAVLASSSGSSWIMEIMFTSAGSSSYT